MTLNKAQFAQLIENYVAHIIEGLDNESPEIFPIIPMEVMLFDLLIREYETYTEEQILGEVTELYGEEVVAELLESVDPHVPVE
jgi:hypothetical protein